MGYAQLLAAVVPLSTQEERHIISEMESDVNTSALNESKAVERLTALLMEQLQRQGPPSESIPPPATQYPPATHTDHTVVDALSMLAVSMTWNVECKRRYKSSTIAVRRTNSQGMDGPV